jgi:hypothetical protein
MFGEDGMHRVPELADAFAVNDSNFKYALFLAGIEIIQDERFHVTRAESMKIENAIDRQIDWHV